MRINLDWLRDWVALAGDVERIAADLTASGLEVDAIEPVGAVLDGVVVAEVQSVARHPKADRLTVCTVDDGAGQHQVVCGAANVAAGIRVPFARVGSTLPSGQSIGVAELRGVTSNGMLCSAGEIGLADDTKGLVLLDADAPVGVSIVEHLKLDDAVLEVNVTPNRGDCFSVLGIARELAARGEKSLRRPAAPPVAVTLADTFGVALEAGSRCPRFVGRVVKGLRQDARTPFWMRERLRRAGLRPIQPIVDVTNYVMLELGQPLHAYDLTKLAQRIDVRLAAEGETLTLLDGRTITLAPDLLVIADAAGPVGLAGIMGGQRTAVMASTNAVFLESAYFTPAATAGRARRLGLHTDASLRFERGVDPTGQARAIERATELLLAIAGGQAGPSTATERIHDVPQRAPVSLGRARLDSVLGLHVPSAEVVRIFERLEMRVEEAPKGWSIVPPAFRFDIAIEEDLIEEVGRMVGYDRIPPTPAATVERLGSATERQVAADAVADLLVARGYAEAITYSFVGLELESLVNPGSAAVELANPIASDLAVMRRSLWPGLIHAARLNVSHQRPRLKLFEIGPQFAANGASVDETTVVAGLALGARMPEHWDGAAGNVDFFDVKTDVETLLALTSAAHEFRFEAATHPALSPGRTARIVRRDRPVGWLGVLHPALQARVDKKRSAVVFALRFDTAFAADLPTYRRYSKFPSIRRDLAVIVAEDITAEALQDAARRAGGEVIQDVVVFDVYRGKGVDSRRKSMGLGLILQDASRTLTDEDADQTMRSVMLSLEREFGATIRT